MTSEDLRLGTHVGNYQLQTVLGSGSFGRVYRAQHFILTDRLVAVKILGATSWPTEAREQFLREARFLEQLHSPFILSLLDAGFIDGIPYLITEYATNGSLRDRLKRHYPRPLSVDVALAILSQIGHAVESAHQFQIIHRDIKPENILIAADGRALLADFGIATMLETASQQPVAFITGSPPYMAPEQFQGVIGKESDQYALGCLAYELFTGKQPFSATDFTTLGFKHLSEQPVPLTQINPTLPRQLEAAVLKALAKRPEDRYPSVADFIDALAITPNAQAGQQGEQVPVQIIEKTVLQSDDVSFLLQAGEQKQVQELQEEALALYEQAVRLNPNEAKGYNGKGIALDALNRSEEALTAYEQALLLDPSNLLYAFHKADSLRRLKRYDEALSLYDQILHRDPSYVQAINGKAVVLYEVKRYEEALLVNQQALALDARNAKARNFQGLILSALKRYEEALAAYEAAVQLSPDQAIYYSNKGETLSTLNRYQEALAAYEQAIRLEPDDARTQTGRSLLINLLNQQHSHT